VGVHKYIDTLQFTNILSMHTPKCMWHSFIRRSMKQNSFIRKTKCERKQKTKKETMTDTYSFGLPYNFNMYHQYSKKQKRVYIMHNILIWINVPKYYNMN
jgi:hypothetical protein